MSRFGALFSRTIIAAAFVGMGLDILFNWGLAHEAFVDQLQLIHCVASGLHCHLINFVHTMSFLTLGVNTLIMILAGLSLLFGFRVLISAILLMLVVVQEVIYLHPFWTLEGLEKGQAIGAIWGAIVQLGALMFCFFSASVARKEPPAPFES